MTDRGRGPSEGPATGEPERDTIVFVSMSQGIGGPARSLLTVLRHLDPKLKPLLFAPAGNLSHCALSEGRVSQHLAMPFDRRTPRRARIRAAVALARHVHRHRDNVLAVHANGQTDLNLTALVLLLTRVPIVMWAHTSRPSPTAGLLGWLWRRTDRVRWLAVSDTARQTLAATLGLDADRIEVVPNPIDPDDVVADHLDGEDVRIAYLGLAAMHKGFDLLAQIVERIGYDDIGLDLYVAPPAPNAPSEIVRAWGELEVAGGSVEVTLQGRTTDVRRAYALCDIVLCPSRQESFGRIAAEAMANGLPVVASDIPAFRELIGDTGAGLLFDLDDPGSAAAAIDRLAHDPALRRELGAQGRRVAQRLAPRAIVAQLETAYRGGLP